jgi:signal transduction histidine kinase
MYRYCIRYAATAIRFMLRVRLPKSSAFRLTVALTSIFLIAVAISAAIAFTIISQELENRHERMLEDDFAFFESTYNSDGLKDLIENVSAHAKAAREQGTIYLLQGPDGKRLAGNVNPVGSLPGAGQVPAVRLGINTDFEYFIKQGEIGDYRLLIGSSAEDISEIGEVFIEGAGWAGLVLLVIAVSGGITLSSRMDRRISSIQSVLEDVANGRFDVEIPQTSSGDDIDRVAELMNDTFARLGATVETNRQISDDISHDLKTPLNHLRIIVEQGAAKQERGQSVIEELHEASGEIQRIISTFDALLRIAQIESGAQKAKFNDIDLEELLKSIGEFYGTFAEDHGMEINVSTHEVPLIRGDRDLLAQLMANLFENALRHCPKGSIIEASLDFDGNAIALTISDNGPGIPAEEHGKVLRRLYRLERSRTTPGSGLGLSLVKAIADLHDAKLTMEDNNPGLRVTMLFPPVKDDRKPMITTSATRPKTQNPQQTGRS